jgi:hypothetical protein
LPATATATACISRAIYTNGCLTSIAATTFFCRN